ncbi:MAG TPA: hypothetical protein VHA77_12315 [Xanthobacteraceae bacterium]|nr:hypothetical protein [Xanthobacteraceae bacterium]
MAFHLVRALVAFAVLASGVAAAGAQDQGGSAPQKGQEKAQAEKAQDKPNAPLVDGMLAVPGAPTQTDTTPSKYSEENAKSDRLLLLDYTFKTLTNEQRAAIYRSVERQKGDTRPLDGSYAAVGLELPVSTDLRPLPKDATEAVPRTKDYRYALAGEKVLLVYPANRYVVGVVGP